MRKEYPSGMWSEREGSLLKYGKGEKSLAHRFSADDKIKMEVSKWKYASIKKAGFLPEQFCEVDGDHFARSLIPEIEAAVAAAKAVNAEREMKEQAELDTDIVSGRAFRTAEIADQYPATLQWARKSEPGDGYASWVIFGYAASRSISVEREAIYQVIGTRSSCGQFPGCSNQAYQISADEWEQIIALSAEIARKHAEAVERREVAEREDLKRKAETGFCFHCGTWCYGDCGHYTSDPEIKFRRDLKQALAEQNYGIKEG